MDREDRKGLECDRVVEERGDGVQCPACGLHERPVKDEGGNGAGKHPGVLLPDVMDGHLSCWLRRCGRARGVLKQIELHDEMLVEIPGGWVIVVPGGSHEMFPSRCCGHRGQMRGQGRR